MLYIKYNLLMHESCPLALSALPTRLSQTNQSKRQWFSVLPSSTCIIIQFVRVDKYTSTHPWASHWTLWKLLWWSVSTGGRGWSGQNFVLFINVEKTCFLCTKWLHKTCFMDIRPLFFYFLVYGFLGGKNGSVGRKKIKNNFFSKGSIMSSCTKKLPVHGNSNKKLCFEKLLNTLNIIKVVRQNYSNISKRNKGNI